MTKPTKMEPESVLQERVAKSPLNFFIRRFNGNNRSCALNSLPRPDSMIHSRLASDHVHSIPRDE